MDEDQRSKVLKDGLVGLWRTSAGTADVLGASDVRFKPDGTGLIVTRSIMFGSEEIPFLWTMAGPSSLRVRYALEDDGTPIEEDAAEWRDIELEFERQQNDLGELDVMGQAGQDGFWFLIDPLRWVGHPDDA